MRRCVGQGRGWPSQICRRSPDPCPVRPGPSSVPGLRVLFLKAQIQIQIQTRTCPLTPNRNFVSKGAGCALPLLSYPIPNSALGSSASTTARGRFVCFPATQALSSDLAHSTLHVAVSLGFVFPAKKKKTQGCGPAQKVLLGCSTEPRSPFIDGSQSLGVWSRLRRDMKDRSKS